MAPSQPPSRAALVLAFASVYLAWGSTYLAIRVGVQSLSPTVLAGARFTIAGAGMLLALHLAGRRIRLHEGDLGRLTVVAVCLLIGGNGLVVWAEQTVPSGLTALLVAIVPLWMAGLAAVVPPRERLPLRAIVGLVLGLVGMMVLVDPTGGTGAADLTGVAALVFASLSWSCGSLYARRAGIRADPLTATAWEMLIGGGLFLALAFVTGAAFTVRPTQAGVAALAYLVTFGSWIGFTAYIWLLAHAPAAKVATYAYVNPVIAVALGWWLLGEPISWGVVAGMTIIVAAVALVTSAHVRSEPSQASAVEAPAVVVPATVEERS